MPDHAIGDSAAMPKEHHFPDDKKTSELNSTRDNLDNAIFTLDAWRKQDQPWGISMNLKRIFGSTAVAATLLWAGAANAALFQFTVSGDYAASWQLDSDRIPDLIVPGLGFTYGDVVGTYADAVSALADVSFFDGGFGGGLSIEDYYGGQFLLVTDGPQIYSGTEENPGYVAGTYTLNEYQGSGRYTLTVSAVPEPASYGMLLAGMGLMAVALRRRR